MKKAIGWIETVLGFIITITSILAMISVNVLLDLDMSEIPSEINGMLDPLLSIIPLVAISYFVIVLLLGVFIFLEGLSKLEKN
jgi:hypothetical protein